jgi:hypothetical protein
MGNKNKIGTSRLATTSLPDTVIIPEPKEFHEGEEPDLDSTLQTYLQTVIILHSKYCWSDSVVLTLSRSIDSIFPNLI